MYMTDFAYDGPIFLVPLSLSYPSSPVYIYIYIYIYIDIDIDIYIYIYIFIFYVCVCVHMYIDMYMRQVTAIAWQI